MKTARAVHSVEFTKELAQARAYRLVQQSRHPRIYKRAVRAENLAREAYVVVADVQVVS
jgi:hypothetical protein